LSFAGCPGAISVVIRETADETRYSMASRMKPILLPEMDPARVSREIGEFVVDQVSRIGLTGCVVGLSGGVDSTTTAAVIKHHFDAVNTERGTSYELVGFVLPSKTNHQKDAEDGLSVACRLGIRHEVHSIECLIEAFRQTNPEAFANAYDRGNLSSRIRSNVLNTKAATECKMVAGTGNKDEDFGIGYYTLFGDGAAHISPIAGLSKRLVREMAKFHGFPDLADREPTAGLEPQQTDFKDLGYRYDLVELVSEGLTQGFTQEELVDHPQVVAMASPQIDDYRRIFGSAKLTSVPEMVLDICCRNRTAKAKAEIIHPPTPAITLEYR
jgi:NAD+ synthase